MIEAIEKEMLQNVLDSMTQAVCWKNREFQYQGCNRKFAEIAGLVDARSIAGKTDEDLSWEIKGAERFVLDCERVMENDTAESRIVEIVADGRGMELHLEAVLAPLHDAEGKVSGLLVTYTDSKEKLYESIIKVSPDVICITNSEARIVMVSQSVVKMFGRTEEELLGQPITNFIVQQDVERARSNIALMFQGIMTGPGEYRGIHKDGRLFTIEVNAELIRDVDRNPSKILFIIRDIS